jgi:hypothetical protein
LIDNSGVSGKLQALNLLSLENGSLEGWGFSLDSIHLEVVSNSFVNGGFKGEMVAPISPAHLKYSSVLSQGPAQGGLRYEFRVLPKDTITVPIWHASIDLLPTSFISILADSGGFKPSMNLNGSIGINTTIGEIPVRFVGVHFQELKVETKAPYISCNTFSYASPEKKMAGFPVSITKVTLARQTYHGMFIRSMGNYDFGPTENITPDSPVSAKAAEFKSRMDEQKKAVADKYSESTGGLDISSEINPLIDEPLDFNDPEEVNAYLRDLNERIDEAKDRIEVLYDDEEANQEEITALEEQVDELTIERDNVQNAFTSRNASKKRAEEAAAKASEGPKTKQEADELIASTERRLARAENSPDSTEERIAQIQETLDNLRALRDTLPETKEKEGEKDGGDTGDRGTDSGRKGKVSGKVERPAPTAKLDRRGNSLWDRNRNVVVGTAVSEAPTADSHRALGRHVPKLFEVPQTEAEFFRNRLIEAAASNKHGTSVTIKPLSE